MKCIKVSFSLPKELWDFIENEKTATGRRGTSHVIQDAIDMMRKSRIRAEKYRKSSSEIRKGDISCNPSCSRPGASRKTKSVKTA